MIHGSWISAILTGSGMSAGLCSSIVVLSVSHDVVDDRGRGRDEVEVELALEPLLDDLEMQQAEEAAAEAEAERGGGLHLVGEAGVVEPQLAHRGAQVLEIGGVDGEQAAEHHRLRRLEAGQRLGGRALVVGDRVADAGVGDLLDLGGDEADLAGAELVDVASSSGGTRRSGRPRRPRRRAIMRMRCPS